MFVFFLKYSIIFLIFCLVCSFVTNQDPDVSVKEKIFVAIYFFMLYYSSVLFIAYEYSVGIIEKNYI